jgi:hypothetical protein
VITNDVVIFAGQPQIASCPRRHRDKPAGTDAWRVALVEDFEANAIKLGDAVQRRNPDVAVRGLHNAAHTVLRKSVVGGPLCCPILGQQTHISHKSQQTTETDGATAPPAMYRSVL